MIVSSHGVWGSPRTGACGLTACCRYSVPVADYTEIPQLKYFVLEESWVLAITATPAQLRIETELVFAKDYPDLRPPREGDLYYSELRSIIFREVTAIEWNSQGRIPATDATGETDWGAIDSFRFAGDEYRLEGDWGAMRVIAKVVDVVLPSAA